MLAKPASRRGSSSYRPGLAADAASLPTLPEGWCWASVDEATWSHDGRRVPVKHSDRASRSGAYPYYGAFGIIDHINDYIFDSPLVLLAEDGKNLIDRRRPVSLVAEGKYWVNNHAHVLEPLADIPHAYLCEFFNSVDLRDRITGIDQVKLTARALLTLPVPVAPLEERALLAGRLQACLGLLTTLREQLTTTELRVRRLEETVLASAFEGKLDPVSTSK